MQIGPESLNNPFFNTNETEYHPVLRANENQEDVFRFIMAHEAEVWECYYLQSCKHLLKEGLALLLKKRAEEEEDANQNKSKKEEN